MRFLLFFSFQFSILISAQLNNNQKVVSESLFINWDNTFEEPKNTVLELVCPKIDTVKIAVIGLGNRGAMALDRLPQIPNVKIVAIADVDSNKVNNCLETYFDDKGYSIPFPYYKTDDWKLICQRNDIDLIYICTHWQLHTPIAVYAMEHDKHVAVEVPAALTIEECWRLVNTAEKTRKHCIQLENCMYDFFELTALNMVQQNLFGEIVHVEGAYIHDLRSLNFHDTYYWNHWRLKQLQVNDGNTYPTHGLGPIAHVLNIHRGDKFNYLVSMSSDQFGMNKYAKEHLPDSSKYYDVDFKKGDINTTLIKTQKGKTILLQHDVTSPRPYSRLYTLSGTNGFIQKYPKHSIALEPNAHSSLSSNEIDSMLLNYQPSVLKEIKDKAKQVGGHGGMDYIMDYRLIYCLRNGLPLDQDVYDAAEWSSIVELSRKSVESGSAPVQIPDFTRGNWNKVKKVSYFIK
ncbi:MAG: Gfo/Idh/MocA family oxidoreductase [Flavobacteriales bacterium]|nr:Gfo/Idh/MocA family oxidoreductase [Flavobacteriales bacterium]